MTIKEDTTLISELTTQELKRSVNEAILRYKIAKERFEFITASELKNDIVRMKRELELR